MNKYLVLVFLLSGCINSYSPQLRTQPSDSQKFESDREICVAQAREKQKKVNNDYTNSGQWLLPAVGGVAGSAINKETASDDFNTSPTEWVDSCMKDKGYDVAPK